MPNDDTQNKPFCVIQFVDVTFGHSTYWTTNQNSGKVLKVVNLTNKKALL